MSGFEPPSQPSPAALRASHPACVAPLLACGMPTEHRPHEECVGIPLPPIEDEDIDLMDLCQCQGCGEYRSTRWLDMSHACHRNEDGTYEEGGTFQ